MPTTLKVKCPVEGCDWEGSAAAIIEHAEIHEGEEPEALVGVVEPVETIDEVDALMDEQEAESEAAEIEAEDSVEIPDPPGADATRTELEVWIGEWGNFDDNEDPADAETADALQRLDALIAAEEEAEPDAEAPAPLFETAPWEAGVSQEIRDAGVTARMRWALVDFTTTPPQLREVFANKESADAAEEIAGWQGAVHRVADIHLVADDWNLQTAAQEATVAAVSDTDPEAGPPATGAALFDASAFDREDLAIPKVDGNSIDRIAIDFGGSIMLDRSEPANVELYNRIQGGHELELWVTGKWGGTGARPATNRDGDLDVIVGRKSLKIDSVRILRPEELAGVEGLDAVRLMVRKSAHAGVPHDQIEAAVVLELAKL
jgi:hypothetical protein